MLKLIYTPAWRDCYHEAKDPCTLAALVALDRANLLVTHASGARFVNADHIPDFPQAWLIREHVEDPAVLGVFESLHHLCSRDVMSLTSDLSQALAWAIELRELAAQLLDAGVLDFKPEDDRFVVLSGAPSTYLVW